MPENAPMRAAMRRVLGMLVAGAVAAAPAAADGGAAVPAAFAKTEIAAKIRGRERVALPIGGVSAWPDPDGGPAWYLDAAGRIAGTREGWFRVVDDGRLQPLGKAAERAFRRDLARRLSLPRQFQWNAGDGKRELVLLTAHDCDGCAWLEEELRDHATQLNVRIHYVIGTLDSDDPESSEILRAITCASDPVTAYRAFHDGDEPPTPAKDCAGQGRAFGHLATLLGARYSPWLVDKSSGEVVPFAAIESDTIVRLLNGKR